MAPVTVETHSDAAIFDRIEDEWDGLLDDSRPEALYLSVAWQRVWWRCLGRGDLGVTTVRDDAGRLIGVAPWFLEDIAGARTWRAIGCLEVGDYLDVVCTPGQAEPVLGALVDFLASGDAPPWDAVDICSLPADSSTLEHLPRLAQAKGWGAETRVQDVAPVISLPGDGEFETYLHRINPAREEDAIVDYREVPRLTPSGALAEIRRLKKCGKLDDHQKKLLDELQNYIKSNFPKRNAGRQLSIGDNF